MYPISRHSGAFPALWLASSLVLAACASDTPLPASPDADGPTEVTAPGGPQAAAASVEHTTIHAEPFEILMSIPCANGGAGEDVQFEGTIRVVDHAVVTGTRVSVFEVAQVHLTGTGLITGDKYESSLAYHFAPVNGSLVNGQFTTSFTAQTAITGPGPGNNMYFPTMIHVTVNALGETTAEVERFPVTCR